MAEVWVNGNINKGMSTVVDTLLISVNWGLHNSVICNFNISETFADLNSLQ
jgi:hypothetical protein